VGRSYIIYLYLDDVTGRLVATNRIRRYLSNENLDVEAGDEVQLLIIDETDFGFRAVVNHRYSGMLYRSELFQPLKIGDRIKGFVKAVRPDNKIDLSLQKLGFENVTDQTQVLLAKLTEAGGTLPIGDKSDPEAIQQLLNMSKKTFKKAAGILMKKGLVAVDDHVIVMIAGRPKA